MLRSHIVSFEFFRHSLFDPGNPDNLASHFNQMGVIIPSWYAQEQTTRGEEPFENQGKESFGTAAATEVPAADSALPSANPPCCPPPQ